MRKEHVFFLLALIFFIPFTSYSEPITISETYHFRTNRSQNTIGYSTGDRLSFGAFVTPVEGTQIVAIQGFQSINLVSYGSEFDGKVDYDPNLTGSWQLTATNGSDSATASTPDRTGVELMPFVTNVKLAGTDEVPRITWDVPQGYGADRVRIQIFDDSTNTGIFSAPAEPITMNDFILPLDQLQYNHDYVMRIRIAATENDDIGASGSGIISRSELFVNFILGEPGESSELFFSTGANPGEHQVTVLPSDTVDLLLNITAIDDNGYPIDPETITHEWLFLAPTIGSVNLGIFLYTGNDLKNLEDVLIKDPSLTSATYDFDHSASDTFSFGKISLENDLGMISGDVLMYGYCFTLTDINDVVIENVVTLNIQ